MKQTTKRFLLGLVLVGATSIAQAADKCTAEAGQAYINDGRYSQAIREFSCVINLHPTEIEGYRGRIEAELLLDQVASAVRDFARIFSLLPLHPDAEKTILAGYSARLAADPNSIPALTGASATYWWFFDYPQAIHLLNRLIGLAPDDVYANLLRGSARLLSGATPAQGAADLERAIVLAPSSPDVRFIVADAYTYGQPDPARAFTEANLALSWGLDTPRIHAILANSYQAFGNMAAAAAQIQIHISQVTTEMIGTSPLGAGGSLSLPLVPGRSYEIPIALTAGQTLSLATSSRDFYDTILVLLAPNGTPVAASDDYVKYFAGLDLVVNATGTYRLWVTSFESVNTGELVVTRK